MNHGEHVNLVRLDEVDDPVRPFDDFANLIHLVFGNEPTRLRERTDLLGALRQMIHRPLGVFGRVLRNKVVDGGKMTLRGVRPMDVHSVSPYLALTSFTCFVRPA